MNTNLQPTMSDVSTQLLAESCLTLGSYITTKNIIDRQQVVIALDNKPIISIGWTDCESQAIADRLLASDQFKSLLEYEYGEYSKIDKMIVKGKEVLTINKTYQALVKSEQGKYENGTGSGQLEAIFIQTPKVLGAAMCINNEVMLCIYPTAKPLSVQLLTDSTFSH